MKTLEEKYDELVRDITSIGFIAKAEARRRLEEIVREELKDYQERVVKMLEGMENRQVDSLSQDIINNSYEAILRIKILGANDILKQAKEEVLKLDI